MYVSRLTNLHMHVYCVSHMCVHVRVLLSSTASGVHISVHSALPTSAGLGSSAAFATCLVTSLLIGFGHISPRPQPDDGDAGIVRLTESDLRLINGWSFVVEKIIHGRPSGIDNSISTYGLDHWFLSQLLEHFLACLDLVLPTPADTWGRWRHPSILLCLQPAPMQPVKLFNSSVHCPLATQLSSSEFC